MEDKEQMAKYGGISLLPEWKAGYVLIA